MNIYLDIDGTLIHEDLTENYNKPAKGLEQFLVALRPFEVFWLTTHCRDGNPKKARDILKQHLSQDFYPDIDRIKPTIWDVHKTQGIDWDNDFIWFDNAISDFEWSMFKNARPEQQAIEVNLKEKPEHLIEILNEIL